MVMPVKVDPGGHQANSAVTIVGGLCFHVALGNAGRTGPSGRAECGARSRIDAADGALWRHCCAEAALNRGWMGISF
ncbi:hypothetical protein GN956_G13036 [Arapaima gigas]